MAIRCSYVPAHAVPRVMAPQMMQDKETAIRRSNDTLLTRVLTHESRTDNLEQVGPDWLKDDVADR